MTPVRLVLSLVVVAALSAPVPAEEAGSKYTREFYRIAEIHQARMAKAKEPLRKKYKADLETLLRRATEAGDLDAALLLRGALDKLEAPAAATIDPTKVKTSHGLRKALVGTSWSIDTDRSKAARTTSLIRFVSGAQVKIVEQPLTSFEAIGRRRVQIGPAILKFDEQLTKYTCDDWFGSGPRFGERR